MYSLVKFNNDELQVVPTKRVQIGKGKQCTVNWKGSKYTADILKLHDSKDILEKEIENLKTKKTKKEKKRRNLLRVELTDVLDVNKAQNNSSRIISDIVVSERQPVHNKNEDIEDENLGTEIEDKNLKTKKTKKEKKRRNLLRVELTDVLDVNKAQNNSSRIISDIVVSERQPVHNKNEDIEDENLGTEIEDKNLKTKKTKKEKKRRNLLRVELTDVLDDNKAQNNSSRIISDIVVSERQPVHNKNEDIEDENLGTEIEDKNLKTKKTKKEKKRRNLLRVELTDVLDDNKAQNNSSRIISDIVVSERQPVHNKNEDIEDENLGTEIEDKNLKTKKTKKEKKRRNLLRVELTDVLDVNKAQNNSSRIISDIVVSERQPVHNKNEDIEDENFGTEIEDEDLKTKKTKKEKKRRNLLRVELTDTLNSDKARNSSLRIISDSVISERQPVHNKNEDDTFVETMSLPANCESCENIADLSIEQLIKNYDFDSSIETVDREMGAEVSYCHMSPVNHEIEFEISAGRDELAPIDVSKTLTNASDSTYIPDQTISVNEISQTSQTSDNFNNCLPVDVRKVTVPQSKTSDTRTTKKYFCPFCKKLQTKFARHLELLHYSQPEVKKFITLPKKNPERQKIIETIRKHGNYIHNTQPQHNTGILITCRQQVHNQNSAEDYVCCNTCKGFFSKRTLRLHYRNCGGKNYKKGVKQTMIMGRRITGYIHPRANICLRQKVFPVLRDDSITRLIKYDELIIIFGNKLCEKYTLEHQHDMIRSHLRLLGRFLIAVKEKDKSIADLSSVFQPKFFDTVLEGIKICASYDPDRRMYGAPSVATTIGTLIKKCLKMHMSECIKTQNETAKKAAEDFLILFEEDIPTTINKKVLEDQLKKKREKVVQLPTMSDISCLYSFLKAKMSEAYDALEKRFTLESYNTLAESTLVLLQTFNRRRAGEIERLLISDYNNQETVDKNANPDVYDNISPESRKNAEKFTRITIRGKLGRVVPVLLDAFIMKCIEKLMRLRQKAGISSKNEYIFAAVSKDGNKKNYIRACPLMRKFSEECGAKTPTALRGTALRKHVATYSAIQGIEEREVTDLANFMGHHKDIHKSVYRVPVPLRDLANVSKILENAVGSRETNDNDKCSNTFDQSTSSSTENNRIDKSVPSLKRSPPIIITDDSVSSESDELSHETNESEDKPIKKLLKRRRRIVSDDSLSDSKQQMERIEEENDPESDSFTDGTHRRSTSPFGKTKRIRWNSDEKSAIADCFGDPTKCSKLPSLNACFEATKTYTALKRRTPQQIKTWIDNQRKAKSRLEAYKLKSRKS